MRLWRLTYELQDVFSSPVCRHFYSLRCFPRDAMTQKVQSCQCDVRPFSCSSRGRDSFGNQLLTGCVMEPHDIFSVTMEAFVKIEDRPETEPKEYYQLGMYRNQTSLTEMGETLNKFYREIPVSGEKDPWLRTEQLMNTLYQVFRYETGSTNVKTTAEEAFCQGCGVCQDYSHILLALGRREGMTVRYIAGAIPGEGETHAWIQVLKDGYWKGFDPTHNRVTDDGYLCLAVGRDAKDCCLNQGIFQGSASQKMEVHVKMEEC